MGHSLQAPTTWTYTAGSRVDRRGRIFAAEKEASDLVRHDPFRAR